MKTVTEIEIFGWVGTAMILLAYILSNFGVLNSASLVYQVLNIVGAFAIVYHSFIKRDFQPMVLNIIWALVAVLAVVKVLF